MKNQFIGILLLFLCSGPGQCLPAPADSKHGNIRHADSQVDMRSNQKDPLKTGFPGFPDRSSNLDVLPGFKNPPEGYGEVSFYWWIGDTLTKDRITWQLDQLKDMSITGLQINYCHTDKGGATYGLTYPSQPALFSPQWWELFQWFLKESKKRGMSVSLSDYTLGAAGQGWYVDEMLQENPGLHGSRLECKQFDAAGMQDQIIQLPSNVIGAVAYPVVAGTLQSSGKVDLMPFIHDSGLQWKAPTGNWKIMVFYSTTVKTSFDPMNPRSGPKVVEKFYQRFEDHCPGEAGKGLNFFFSDELQFGIRGFLWNDRFAYEFRKRKGYDIIAELPHLFAVLGPRSYKIRMDYNDVMVSLSEEGFFRPVYEWHTSRGMLFGCDHGGRGRDVTEFGDYFRTQRWMSGPGCDQPGLGRDIIKNKVASSIAHLYERPRTWLEGFYGSGWGTSSEEIADATFANFAMGQNLLSLHGLYYTTHGSWWEWAAPDNHWRQPYWKEMSGFLTCAERLSYVLSQGHHRCDVAMIYPVAPMEAGLRGKESVETSFAVARDLYPAGIDFDFMDFESLERCQIRDKELKVSGEMYKVLILPALSAVRYSTMEKALAFFRAGGIVLAVGVLPEVSDRKGGDDAELQAMIREMFGTTFLDKHDTTKVYSQRSKSGGKGIFFHDPLEAKSIIRSLIQPDFEVSSGLSVPGILHRKIGPRDLYFVYGLPKGTLCSFRSAGKVELWDPWTGTISPLKVASVSESATTLALLLEKSEAQLIVFSPGKPEIEESGSVQSSIIDTLILDNNWEFELHPTLDNRYGDFRLPAFDGKLGVEIWKMKFSGENRVEPGQSKTPGDGKWTTVSVGFGPQFWKLGPLPDHYDPVKLEADLSLLKQVNPEEPVEVDGRKYFWQPYEFSWRWGLKDDAGHQGYHGLKGVVNNEVISLGVIDPSRKHIPVYPLLPEPEGKTCYLWSTVSSTKIMQAEIHQSGLVPEKIFVNHRLLNAGKADVELKEGFNPVLLKYSGAGRGVFIFTDGKAEPLWKQPVPLATRWYINPSVLPYNCKPEQKEEYGLYRFMSPPGSRAIYVSSKAKPEIRIAGKEYSCIPAKMESGRVADPDLTTWKVALPEVIAEAATVDLKIEQLPGFSGGAAIPEPVVIECGKGSIKLEDLGENESLRTYSGGMWYRKTIGITAELSKSEKIILDLGEVVASAEVFVNGKSLGSKIAPPWTFDLSGQIVAGDNYLEILVSNTLGNHYLTTPSQYTGRTHSGLMGPVKIEFVNH